MIAMSRMSEKVMTYENRINVQSKRGATTTAVGLFEARDATHVCTELQQIDVNEI